MKRTFTVRFGRSVSSGSGRPEKMTVIVQSLSTSNNITGDTTFPSVSVEKKISLSGDDNKAVFELEPSYQPGIDRPILYRVSWRKEFLGRVETTDFTMPNADITYDDLFDLGAIVGSETYLQEADLGTRVARLNDEGQVIDRDGNVVTGGEASAALEVRIATEENTRRNADLANRQYAASQLEIQVNSVVQSTDSKIAAAITEFRQADAQEVIARQAAVSALNQSIGSIMASHTAQLATLTDSVTMATSSLATKADLVNGKIPTSQMPSIALTTAVVVDNEQQMLAQTSAQVQPGDIAIRPDSTWMLVSSNPALLASWKKLAAGGGVSSVNGQIGNITLGAADVGARPAGVALTISEVTNLTTELAAKLTQADLSTINTALQMRATVSQLNVLRSEAVIKTVQGFVPTSLLGADVPLVNNLNQLVKKDGTVISTGGGSGAVASVNGQVGTVNLTAADVSARDLSTLVPLTDVDGLVAALGSKANQTALASALQRISAAESDIDNLQASGPGGGGGSSRNVVSWMDDGSDNIAAVAPRSPFGRTSAGTLYYNHLGAVDAEAVVPYVNISGALTFRKVDLNATPDPAWARASDLAALTEVVSGKATQAALTSLSARVDAKADTSALNTLSARVDGKADTSALTSLSQTVALKANQTSLDNTNQALGSKVDTSTYDDRQASLDQQLLTKYQIPVGGIPQSTLDSNTQSKINRGDAARTSIDAATSSNAANQLVKTDANGLFTVPDATAAGHPYRKSQVDALVATRASASDMTTQLAAKADLVGGKIPTSQISSIITHETVAVANRSAMLALTTAQVQLGDTAIITGTSDVGTYTLVSNDPTQFGNWLKHTSPADVVQSVNGYTGTIILSAGDIGARSLTTLVPLADVSGLQSALTAKADVSYVNTQVSTRTTPSQVAEQVSLLGQSRVAVDYAATAPVASLSGQQSIDGVLVGLDTRVLLPLQNSSPQNGIWVVKSGAWIRPTDMPNGGTVVPNSLIAVKSGVTNADSLWQMTTTSLVTVDTSAQNWAKILRGGLPKVYTGPNASGILIDNTANTISVKAGTNIIVDGNGVSLDPTGLLRKRTFAVPAGSATVTLSHGLNTQDIWCTVRDASNQDINLIGQTAITLMACTIEFESAPGSNTQWVATVWG